MPGFVVTFENWDEESTEIGETNPDDKGVLLETASLREAVGAVLATETNETDYRTVHICPSGDIDTAKWFEVTNSPNFRTGDVEIRSLHLPEGLTPATIRRIARLIGIDVPVPEPEVTQSPRM